MGYVALVLDEASREDLLAAFPPKYGRVIAHHVTLKFGVSLEEVQEVLGTKARCYVLGYAYHDGVDCVAVVVGHPEVAGLGTCHQPDGTRLHITLSCADGVRPVMARHAAQKVPEYPAEACLILTGSIQFIP